MRGQFIRGDGLIIPNNISIAGAQMLLGAALRNTVPTLFAALVQGQPDPDMTMADMLEPTVGNGYVRKAISRDNPGWPVLSTIGVEAYAETDWITWTPTGPGFDRAIQRVALLGTATVDSSDPVFCLSEALAEPITLLATTPLEQRRFKYRIYI